MQDSVFVTLSEPLKYGDNQSTDKVEIRCPSFGDTRDRKYYRHLQSMMANVIREMSGSTGDGANDVATDPTDVKVSSKELIFMLMISMGGDGYHDEVERFMARADRCCFLNDASPLQSGPASRIHPDDQAHLFGSYLENFTLPGLMSLMTGKN